MTQQRKRRRRPMPLRKMSFGVRCRALVERFRRCNWHVQDEQTVRRLARIVREGN